MVMTSKRIDKFFTFNFSYNEFFETTYMLFFKTLIRKYGFYVQNDLFHNNMKF